MDVGVMLILVTVAVILLVVAAAVTGRARRRPVTRALAVNLRCLRCRGTGWIIEAGRTLDFTGDGFADRQAPAARCTACGGTGTAALR